MRLSKYFTKSEAEFSITAANHGRKNSMGPASTARAKLIAVKVMDKIREYYGVPIVPSSWFRGKWLNKQVGGSLNSQHCIGEAVDFRVPGVSVKQVYEDIKSGKIPGVVYDQLIYEIRKGGAVQWIHISYTERRKNRMMAWIDR